VEITGENDDDPAVDREGAGVGVDMTDVLKVEVEESDLAAGAVVSGNGETAVQTGEETVAEIKRIAAVAIAMEANVVVSLGVEGRENKIKNSYLHQGMRGIFARWM